MLPFSSRSPETTTRRRSFRRGGRGRWGRGRRGGGRGRRRFRRRKIGRRFLERGVFYVFRRRRGVDVLFNQLN